MPKFLSLMFALVFFLQSSAWATSKIPKHKAQILAEVVKKYNGMTALQRYEEFKSIMKTRPQIDQDFVKQAGDISTMKFPDIKIEDEQISIVGLEKNISIVPDSGLLMGVNGEKIDFGPGKLAEAHQKIERILGKKTVSVFDLFISNAFADIVVAVIVAFLATLVVTMFASLPNIFSASTQFDENLRNACEEPKKLMNQLTLYPGTEDFRYVKSMVDRNLYEIHQKDQFCNRYDKCLKAKRCLEALEIELNSRPAARNEDDRSSEKDLPGAGLKSDTDKQQNTEQ